MKFHLSIIFILATLNLSAETKTMETKGTTTKSFDASKINLIQIEAPKGEIEILSTMENKIKVEIEKLQFDPKCKMSFTEEGSTLKIIISQENLLFDKATCASKIKVHTHAKSNLKITTGTSASRVSGITGEINFKSATGVFSGIDLEGNFYATTATGNIDLKYKKCSERADIEILSASADAEISLPSNCKLKVSHKSAAGELFNEIGETSDYRMMIKMKSGSGNLKIKKI